MRLQILFPRWRGLSALGRPLWRQDVDLRNDKAFETILQLLLHEQNPAQKRGLSHLNGLSIAICEDILDLTNQNLAGVRDLNLLRFVINWAASIDHPSAAELAEMVEAEYRKGDLLPNIAASVCALFATVAGNYTGDAPNIWAGRAFKLYRDQLHPQKLLSLMHSTIPDQASWQSVTLRPEGSYADRGSSLAVPFDAHEC